MGLFTPTGLLGAAVLAAAFVGVFYFFFWTQGQLSWGSGDWSHSFLVPLISAYLLYQNRRDIVATTTRVFWPGLLPLVLGLACYASFQVSSLSNHMAQGWAMVLSLFGLVLLTCGPKISRLTLLPIAYLLMGITISEKVMIGITFKMQLIASQGAYMLLNLLGVETTVDGNTLQIINSSGTVCPLNVAEACSGMRMVIAFIALGVAVALVAVRHWWQRAALLAMAVPVALLMNILRVAVLGVATLVDPNVAAGQSHMLIGTLLLLPAFGLYMGVVWALNKAVHEPPTATAKPSGQTIDAPPGRSIGWPVLRQPRLAVPLALLAVAAVGLPATVAALGIHLRKTPIYAPADRKVQAIPTETARWIRVGTDTIMKEEMVESLGTSNYLSRTYVERKPAAGRPPRRLDLHLAYYTGMIDTVPHVSERCMLGSGFTITTGSQVVPLPLDKDRLMLMPAPSIPKDQPPVYTARHSDRYGDFKSQRTHMPRGIEDAQIRVTEFTPPRGTGHVYIGYFFIANGGLASNAEEVRLRALNLTDDYAYYLKIQITSREAASAQELADASADLLSDLLPDIMRCAPDWVAVQRGDYPDDNPRRGSNPPAR